MSRAPSLLAAARSPSLVAWAYIASVNLGSECPSLVCAVLTSTPSATIAVALVLRRSWKLRPSKPAAFTAGSQTLRRQLE